VFQYSYDALRVAAAGTILYGTVKLCWEGAYEVLPDAFRSTELAAVSGERARQWRWPPAS
jgi:hypothetical protein